ncbi:MAG: diacylglycerol/lipid kinase family protein [Actinomycetota bacterium]
MTDVLLISNPSSGSSDEALLSSVRGELSPLGSMADVQPSSLESFEEEVKGARSGASVVIVAGGDGTFNCTVNALSDLFDEVTLGLVPMGTGNDFGRTLGLPEDPLDAARAIARGARREIDVGRASSGTDARLFVNACMGGFPVDVNEAIDEGVKKRFGPLAFWVGGLKAAKDLTRYRISLDGHELDEVLAVGVGNGQTCGGGIRVWPDARPDDRRLDACALAAASLPEALQLASKVRDGNHLGLEGVTTAAGERLVVDAEPRIEFNVDGDLVGMTSPVTFELAGRFTVLAPADAQVA